MNKDINKFVLIAYEKGNINNRKSLKYYDKEKYGLTFIDFYTSKYKKEEFYNKLVDNGVIKKEQTEFVIWYKEKDKIKQIPVIFNNIDIHIYSSYLKGNTDVKKTVDRLNKSVFNRLINKLKIDLDKYDNNPNKEYFINNYEITKMPFMLHKYKERIQNRLIGIYDIKSDEYKKSGYNYNKNYENIRNDIETSYRCFRDTYLFLETDASFSMTYIDLSYDDIFNNTNKETKKIYDMYDFFNLLESRDNGNTLNSYMGSIDVLSKEIRKKINVYQKTADKSGNDYDRLRYDIIIYNDKHDNIIVNLLNEYMNQKKITKK